MLYAFFIITFFYICVNSADNLTSPLNVISHSWCVMRASIYTLQKLKLFFQRKFNVKLCICHSSWYQFIMISRIWWNKYLYYWKKWRKKTRILYNLIFSLTLLLWMNTTNILILEKNGYQSSIMSSYKQNTTNQVTDEIYY